MKRIQSKAFVIAAGLLLSHASAHAGPAQMKLTASDYVEIEQLYSHYAHYLDSGDGSRFAALFTEDGAFITNNPQFGVIQGQTRLAAFAAQVGSPPPAVKPEHFTTNIMIDPSAAGATGSAYLQADKDKFLYHDAFVKTAKGWRFKTREVHLAGCEGDWPCGK